VFALTPPFPWLSNTEADEAGSDAAGLAASTSMAATSDELIAERLRNQHLTRPGRRDPMQVVASLGAMQAQDFPAAKWAIGLRAPGCDSGHIEDAFNNGSILRTHLLRPTWHFVAPDDIKWMVELSAPRVNAANAYYYRQAGLNAKIFARSCAMISRVLEGGRYQTRAELAVALKRAKVPADGLKLAYIMMHAELDGVICSGPRRGKQFTYALLSERAPQARSLDRRDAIAELTGRYFASHGPATIRDFVWWSGLTVKDAQLGVEAARPRLHKEDVGGREYWSATPRKVAASKGCTALLLPNFDEYLIAYKDRGGVVDSKRAANIVARSNGAFSHHLVIDGRLAGSWTRTLKGNSVLVEVAPYHPLTPVQSRAVMSAVDCYGEFLAVPASLSIV
jgi:Winged helix DNA-binding domain